MLQLASKSSETGPILDIPVVVERPRRMRLPWLTLKAGLAYT